MQKLMTHLHTTPTSEENIMQSIQNVYQQFQTRCLQNFLKGSLSQSTFVKMMFFCIICKFQNGKKLIDVFVYFIKINVVYAIFLNFLFKYITTISTLSLVFKRPSSIISQESLIVM